MGIPKRTQNFRDKAKEEAYDAQKEYEESYKTKDDRGFQVGSVFNQEIIKELGVEIWRPDVGEHVIDVIPFYAGSQHPTVPKGKRTYKVDFWAHQRIGTMNDFLICNAMTWKKPDVICSYMSANYIEDKKQYRALKSSRRCAYLVWVHDNEEQEAKGIQIFEVAHFFFEKKVSEIARMPRGGGFIDWTCFDKGRHVYWTINTTGSYEDASGTKRDSIEYTAFQLIVRDKPAIPDHILSQSFALDEVIKMHPTDEEYNLAFYGKETAPEVTTSPTSDRLPQKSAIDRAREQTEKQQEDEDKKELIENLICEVCAEEDIVTEIYDSKSGRVCEKGHGGIEGIPYPTKDETPPPDEKKETSSKLVTKTTETPKEEKSQTTSDSAEVLKSDDSLVCPASELGGVFGETIEQIDACDDCDIWEECNDENTRRRKSGTGKLVSR